MSTIRKTFRVAWGGQDAVKVGTNAWDMVVATDEKNTALMTFKLVHNALHRTGHVVPKFHDFVAQLDDVEDVTEEIEPDPTQSVPQSDAPLPYRP